MSRDKVVQSRTLLRPSNTQSSMGSGFFVSADGLIVTSFHVASRLALEPERYRGVYLAIDGQKSALALLVVDVQRDLAVLRATRAQPQRAGRRHAARRHAGRRRASAHV